MGDLVPRDRLIKNGLKGFGAVGGGMGILILKALSTNLIVGLIAAGLVAVIGVTIGSSKEDRTAGLITLGVAAVTAVAAIVPGLRWLMSISGWGLIAAGGITLFRFFRNLKKRI
ncbi:MAG: hypothetical protein GXP33_13640 [Spirochaetes bacterium]|nr:hypothetical protein [Spirochaetota bacterium]